MPLGIVTTANVCDAAPVGMGHTSSCGAGTGIVDQCFDARRRTGLVVLMGGCRGKPGLQAQPPRTTTRSRPLSRTPPEIDLSQPEETYAVISRLRPAA